MPVEIIWGMALFSFIQFFVLYTIIYGFYTVAKMIKIKEENSSKPTDIFGTFILFWFLPFTIGRLQKRIRKIIAEDI